MGKRESPRPQDRLQSKRLKSGIDSDDDMDDTTQLVPMISRSETDNIQRQYKHDSAMADEDSEDEFVDAPEEITRADLNMPPPPPSQDEIIDVSDGQDDEEADDSKSNAPSEDLFAKHFGSAATPKADDEDDTKSNAAYEDLFAKTFGQSAAPKEDEDDEKNSSDTDSHAEGCKETARRFSTPPVPTPDLLITSAATKKPTPPKADNTHDKKEEGRTRPGPDIDRDLSNSLRMHFRFHDRVAHLIPRLNAPDFAWGRRYWIAVLSHTKQAKNATNEKDFVWMKGNRLSTGKTILHKYAEVTMADVEGTVLMLGHERLRERDTMEECDFFGDRLVVLRAVEMGGEDGVGKLREKSLVEGLVRVVPEVVEID